MIEANYKSNHQTVENSSEPLKNSQKSGIMFLCIREAKWELWMCSLMKQCKDMTEKQSFQKVIVVCVVGAILILIVPMVFHTIFK